MKLHLVTIALDAIHFLPTQLRTFNALQSDWTWHVAEGVAKNVKCTSWCKEIAGRLSNDGTTQFLAELRTHPRLRLHQRTMWDGKVSMFNTMLEEVNEECVLLEVDADEMWLPDQIDLIVSLFEHHPPLQCARFFCRYFVGPHLITKGENCYGNNPGEWLRAWRFTPGQTFLSHEPPHLSGHTQPADGNTGLTRQQTREYGLVFDHYAYAFRHQLEFKQKYYGYANAIVGWSALQNYKGPWPVKLKAFFPWVDDRVEVTPGSV